MALFTFFCNQSCWPCQIVSPVEFRRSRPSFVGRRRAPRVWCGARCRESKLRNVSLHRMGTLGECAPVSFQPSHNSHCAVDPQAPSFSGVYYLLWMLWLFCYTVCTHITVSLGNLLSVLTEGVLIRFYNFWDICTVKGFLHKMNAV